MQQHIYYIKFALRFADMQIPELVTVFNAQVQSRGWSSIRAYHNQALLDEFQHRGIDTTAVKGKKHIVCPSYQERPAKQQIGSDQLTLYKFRLCSLLLQRRSYSSAAVTNSFSSSKTSYGIGIELSCK